MSATIERPVHRERQEQRFPFNTPNRGITPLRDRERQYALLNAIQINSDRRHILLTLIFLLADILLIAVLSALLLVSFFLFCLFLLFLLFLLFIRIFDLR